MMTIKITGEFQTIPRVSTGIYSLDVALGNPRTRELGMPLRTYYELYGNPEQGKSTLAYYLAGNFAKDKTIALCDIEGLDMEYVVGALELSGFDGELYNHDLHDDFNELMSIFKKLNPTREDLKKSSEIGQFHIYDLDILYDTSRYNTSTGQIIHKDSLFSERSAALKDIHETFMKSDSMIILTETTKIHNKIELDAMYDDYAARNYEGQMVRDDSPYMNHRTKHILKRKKFHDAEYELVDILQGEGNWEGKAKRAVLRDRKTGEIFGAGILGDMKYCANILSNKDKYIGSETTVNYQVLSPDKNVPIFGRVKEFGRTDNLKFYGK